MDNSNPNLISPIKSKGLNDEQKAPLGCCPLSWARMKYVHEMDPFLHSDDSGSNGSLKNVLGLHESLLISNSTSNLVE